MKNLVLLFFFSTAFGASSLCQNCSIKFIVKDAKDGSVLAEADISSEVIVKATSSNGEALFIGMTCGRLKFRIEKSGYQPVRNFQGETKEIPSEYTIELTSWDRLQANVFQKLRDSLIDFKEIKKMNEELTNAYKKNNDSEQLSSYKVKLETAVLKLKDDGILTRKQVKEIL